MIIRIDIPNFHDTLKDMIKRAQAEYQVTEALRRAPVVALLGPRQCGKTTLAMQIKKKQKHKTHIFDLERTEDARQLEQASLTLAPLRGLVVIDEIQRQPELFALLRVLADRRPLPARFLILGSASPDLIRKSSDSLAGRIAFVELGGFDMEEAGLSRTRRLLMRGGLPRSFLAKNENDSRRWRENFIKTFLERDMTALGNGISPALLERFWAMLAHYHGQTWNASEIGRSLGLSDKTVRHYLDLLAGTFMVRVLQPWHANLSKRQVKAPKIYIRDSGLLHTLLTISDWNALLRHPKLGASWEGFAMEQCLRRLQPLHAYFWGTHNGVELDLLLMHKGHPIGFEFKWDEAPGITRSMLQALNDLKVKKIWVVYPGTRRYPIHERITAIPLQEINMLEP